MPGGGGGGDPRGLRTFHLSLAGMFRNLVSVATALSPGAPDLFVKDEICELTCFLDKPRERERESRAEDVTQRQELK